MASAQACVCLIKLGMFFTPLYTTHVKACSMHNTDAEQERPFIDVDEAAAARGDRM